MDLATASSISKTREDVLDALKQRLAAIVEHDSQFQSLLLTEEVDPDRLLDEAKLVLEEQPAEFIDGYRQLATASEREEALQPSRRQERWETVGGFLALPGSLAIIAIVVISVLKWTGRLTDWSYQPWVITASVSLAIAGVVSALGERWTRNQREQSGVTGASVDRAASDLDERLRSLVLMPALRRASSPSLTDPATDTVGITEAPSLGARIAAAGRIETLSYRRVLIHLKREGGSTIGLSGRRGSGKSELLRSFCEDSEPNVEQGGRIGILLAAPVAYKSESFLRLLIKRLCQRVPGYSERAVGRPLGGSTRSSRFVGIVGLTVFVIGGVILLREHIGQDLQTWGIIIVALGLLLMYASALQLWLRPSGARLPLVEQLLRTRKDENPRASIGLRRSLARDAEEVAQRVTFAETRDAGGEASLGMTVGAKLSSSISLAQIPLTEADLVNELETLIGKLSNCGYEIVIGIDELDKMEDDKDAAAFLNSMKVLFPIPGCSFLVTISEDAWARFASRGLPIRDVFDSSLDAVVVMDRLTFLESRSFLKRRSAKMSDTEALFCHCLSGGLPRDLLRFARQLGEANLELGGSRTLSELIPVILQDELRAKVDAVALAARSREQNAQTVRLYSELEMLSASTGMQFWKGLLDAFLESDSEFKRLISADAPQPTDQPDMDASIRRLRRELFTYLCFLCVLATALAPGNVDVGGRMDAFECVVEARHRIELEPSAGWRELIRAQELLGPEP